MNDLKNWNDLKEMGNLKDWRFHIDFEGLAWAILDREGESTNTLGRRAWEELEAILTRVEAAAQAKRIRGLVFMSGKETSFIAGADIREFESFTTEAEVREAVAKGTALLDRIEKLPVPTVAAIHGHCLGGGLELSMACDWRIADREDDTRLGLPEVKLGIFPGLNGTMRSVRLAGAMDAMQMMLTGRMLRSPAARAIGIVDQLVPTHHRLRWAARKAALGKMRSRGAALWKRPLRYWPLRSWLARQMTKKTAGKVREDHYPAPFKLIELFEKYGGSETRMKIAETRGFAPLMVSETARNLQRVFRLSEMLKDLAPKDVDFCPLRIHVVGAGTMGADIAAWCVLSGMEVSIQDLSDKQLGVARERAKTLFRRRLRGKTAVDAAMARFILDKDGRHLPRADLVIEAIVEKLEAKQGLLMMLEPRLKPGAVLATNTSSLPVEDIALVLEDPGRLIGLHFFNPVAQLPLVEVVKSPLSREVEVKRGCAFVKAIRKFPLIVASKPGFLVNRVLAPYMMAAIQRFEDGEKGDKIDAAARAFGMPMGPLELADQVGLDICLEVAGILGIDEGTGKDSRLGRLVAEGKLGKKTGSGFYEWEKGKPKKEPGEYDSEELARLGEALVAPLIDECERCLEDGIVANADLVDAGVIFGTGFAVFRGGPLHYRAASTAGHANVPSDADAGVEPGDTLIASTAPPAPVPVPPPASPLASEESASKAANPAAKTGSEDAGSTGIRTAGEAASAAEKLARGS